MDRRFPAWLLRTPASFRGAQGILGGYGGQCIAKLGEGGGHQGQLLRRLIFGDGAGQRGDTKYKFTGLHFHHLPIIYAAPDCLLPNPIQNFSKIKMPLSPHTTHGDGGDTHGKRKEDQQLRLPQRRQTG